MTTETLTIEPVISAAPPPGSRVGGFLAKLSLIVTFCTFAILLNSVGTVILQAVRTLGVDERGAAILEAFKDLPIAITSFAVASFLPRLGYKRAMIIGLGLVALACLGMPLFQSFWATKLLFTVVGISFAMVKTSTYASIGLLTRNSLEHASLTNFIEGMFMVGALGGYWVFAAFVDSTGQNPLGWLNVYWLLSFFCALNIALVLASPFGAPVANPKGGMLADLKLMPQLLMKTPILIFFVASFLYVFIEQGIGSWLPTFNAQVLHLPVAMSVQAASVYVTCLAFGRLTAGALMRRVGWLAILISAIVLMAVLIIVAMPLAAGVKPDPNVTLLTAPIACFVIPAIGLFLAPIYPTINSVVLSSLPKSHHASAAGLMIAFAALGGTTGSLITGHLFALFGGAMAFHLALIPIGILGICLYGLHTQLKRAADTTT